MNHPDPGIAQQYRTRATFGTRCFPEVLDYTLLLTWIADTRGESLTSGATVDEFQRSHQQAGIHLKEELESSARTGGIALEIAVSNLWPNVAWILIENPTFTSKDAFNAYFMLLQKGTASFADSTALKASNEVCESSVAAWLVGCGIPHYMGQSVVISPTRMVKALKAFDSKPDVFFTPNIPATKLENARSTCGVPDEEAVALLIDCTFFGSAKDALLFGSKAIYFNNGATAGFLPYSELHNRTFNNCMDSQSQVSLGNGMRIDLAGSQVTVDQCVSILEIVRKETTGRSAEASSVGLASIPGMHSLKATLLEDVISVLNNADEYKKYGLALPNGLLFYGPPGCGKTFIAQHLAKELAYNFYEISPGSIASPYIHDTVLKIKEIFDIAAKSSPSVVFVDEFEGLVPSRRFLSGDSHHKAEEVNEWLTQIGTCAERNILFIAATNEPWKIDEAIRRTGRLDKKLYIGPPDEEAIKEMIAFHSKGRPLENEQIPADIARFITGQGYSASDLKALVDEAAKCAMKERTTIGLRHFQIACSERLFPSITSDSEALFLEFR